MYLYIWRYTYMYIYIYIHIYMYIYIYKHKGFGSRYARLVPNPRLRQRRLGFLLQALNCGVVASGPSTRGLSAMTPRVALLSLRRLSRRLEPANQRLGGRDVPTLDFLPVWEPNPKQQMKAALAGPKPRFEGLNFGMFPHPRPGRCPILAF